MPRYLTQHTLACLTRQGAEALAQRMQAGGLARAERVLVNMLEGKMFVEFRADSRENLEAWLKTEGMHLHLFGLQFMGPSEGSKTGCLMETVTEIATLRPTSGHSLF